ncbi:MAG: hypothetical protein OXJ90_18420, partial [Spirochaetaceae bacterium]|nr:hypothetical protein [Spirochaetaceae bacterium]
MIYDTDSMGCIGPSVKLPVRRVKPVKITVSRIDGERELPQIRALDQEAVSARLIRAGVEELAELRLR